ncbi:alpha/beta hydrolase family protein [Streptacidiphilus monticola]
MDVDVLQGRAVRPTPQPVPLRLAPLQGDQRGAQPAAGDASAGHGSGLAARRQRHSGGRRPLEAGPHGPTPGRGRAVGGSGVRGRGLVDRGAAGHGPARGPADAWRLEFDPTLQRLAAAGSRSSRPTSAAARATASRTPRPCGGLGRPGPGRRARAAGEHRGQRESLGLDRVALFGFSYGAFLALLAACTVPEHVARVAAVAPFLSGARLAAEAGPEVRTAAERLGADQEPPDGRGPRDVLALLDRLAAQLLVVHGVQDDVVPVGQSRLLRQELLRLGRVEGGLHLRRGRGRRPRRAVGRGAPLWQELLSDFLAGGR